MCSDTCDWSRIRFYKDLRTQKMLALSRLKELVKDRPKVEFKDYHLRYFEDQAQLDNLLNTRVRPNNIYAALKQINISIKRLAPAQPYSLVTHTQPYHIAKKQNPGERKPTNLVPLEEIGPPNAAIALTRVSVKAWKSFKEMNRLPPSSFKNIRVMYESLLDFEELVDHKHPAIEISDDGEVIGADPSHIKKEDLERIGVPFFEWSHDAIVTNCLVCASAGKYRTPPEEKIAVKAVADCAYIQCPCHWIREQTTIHAVLPHVINTAINDYCLKCRDGNAFEVTICSVVSCPFWQFRDFNQDAFLHGLQRTNPLREVLFDHKPRLNQLRGPKGLREKHEKTGLTEAMIHRGSSLIDIEGSRTVSGRLPSSLTRRQVGQLGLIDKPFKDYIRNMCLSCKDDNLHAVLLCAKTSCPLNAWRFRVGLHDPDEARKEVATEEPYALEDLERVLADSASLTPTPTPTSTPTPTPTHYEQKPTAGGNDGGLRPPTAGEAIRDFCLDCRDGIKEDVKQCVVTACPLWLVREAPRHFWKETYKNYTSKLFPKKSPKIMEFRIYVENAKIEIMYLLQTGKKVPKIPQSCLTLPGVQQSESILRQKLMARRAWSTAIDELGVVPAGKIGGPIELADPIEPKPIEPAPLENIPFGKFK